MVQIFEFNLGRSQERKKIMKYLYIALFGLLFGLTSCSYSQRMDRTVEKLASPIHTINLYCVGEGCTNNNFLIVNENCRFYFEDLLYMKTVLQARLVCDSDISVSYHLFPNVFDAFILEEFNQCFFIKWYTEVEEFTDVSITVEYATTSAQSCIDYLENF